MTIEAIEPALWDLREQIENLAHVVDKLEERIVDIEMCIKKAGLNIAV